MNFLPGFSTLVGLQDGATTEGRWTVRLGGVDITGGGYSVSRAGDSVTVSLDVTEPWKPAGLPLSIKIFTGIVRKFRLWPTTCRWRSIVRDGNPPTMLCGWERRDT